MNKYSDEPRYPPALQRPIDRDDDVVDIGELVSTIWRGKWVIAGLAAISVLIGGYYAYVMATPLFRSTAVVMLETRQESVVDLQAVVGGMTGDMSEVNSELEVLQSRGLLGKVVDKLELVNDPEFNFVLQEPGFFTELKYRIKDALGLLEEVPELPADVLAKRIRDDVISVLLEKLSIRNVPLSLVFQVTAETESPEKSALVADTVVELYILNQLEVKFEATEQATSWLTGRVAELQVQLEDAEAKVSEFSASTNLISAEALQAQEIQLKDLRERIRGVESALETARDRVQILETADTPAAKAEAADDPQLSRLLARSQADERLSAAFDARFESLLARANLELERSIQQLTALRASRDEIETEISQRGEDLIVLQQLTREAEAVRLLYEYFLARLKETAAQEGIQKADSRVLSSAVVPTFPSAPRKSLILAMSGILGLMMGTAFVLLREARNNGFRTARDLEALTGYSVLGQIPQIPARGRRKALHYLASKPTSAAAEAVRNLRTSLLMSNVDNPPKIVVSTSSIPGEGKTTNSLALAQNLVGLGKSVLLIEGDIRRRTLSQYFDGLPEQGLVSVLSGDISLEEAIHSEKTLGCDLLIGEKTSINAADLFASEKFKALIKDVRTKYDMVIIDTPPILVVPDARIIAQSADATLFTVEWDKTSKQQVEEALRVIHNSNQRITGLVLSQINAKRMKAYGYGGKYGAYAGYGAKYYTS